MHTVPNLAGLQGTVQLKGVLVVGPRGSIWCARCFAFFLPLQIRVLFVASFFFFFFNVGLFSRLDVTDLLHMSAQRRDTQMERIMTVITL